MSNAFQDRRSTGPKTEASRHSCAAAKIVHGNETAAKRLERSEASTRLAVLEMVGHTFYFMQGPKTRGRKPNRMDEAYPKLQLCFQNLVLKNRIS